MSRLSSNPGRSVRYAFHRALHQTVYTKLFADLWDGLGATLVVHHRGSGYDTHTAQLGQIADKLIGHSFGEVLLA